MKGSGSCVRVWVITFLARVHALCLVILFCSEWKGEEGVCRGIAVWGAAAADGLLVLGLSSEGVLLAVPELVLTWITNPVVAFQLRAGTNSQVGSCSKLCDALLGCFQAVPQGVCTKPAWGCSSKLQCSFGQDCWLYGWWHFRVVCVTLVTNKPWPGGKLSPAPPCLEQSHFQDGQAASVMRTLEWAVSV